MLRHTGPISEKAAALFQANMIGKKPAERVSSRLSLISWDWDSATAQSY